MSTSADILSQQSHIPRAKVQTPHQQQHPRNLNFISSLLRSFPKMVNTYHFGYFWWSFSEGNGIIPR